MDTTVVNPLIVPTGEAMLNMLLPVLLSLFVIPLMARYRKWVPIDFPIGVPAATLAVTFGILWLSSLWLSPELTAAQIFVYALGADKLMQLVYTGGKTVKKLKK